MRPFEASAGRRCHSVLSPVHTIVYFAPEPADALAELGLERGSMACLAGRAAPLGVVSAGTATATFDNVNHEHVARYIPAAWAVTTPEAMLEARLNRVDGTLRRLLGEEALAYEMAEAAELALRATEACSREARPLYTVNADLPVTEEPHPAKPAVLLRRRRHDEAHVRRRRR